MEKLLLCLFFWHLCISLTNCHTNPSSKFPAILIFGDSTVDTGNNNFITTFFRADHVPYGVSFPHHSPTGRFSDGKLVPDLVASQLGIKETVPPFLDPTLSDNDIRTGVCFASAGSGFDVRTTIFSGVIPVPNQLFMFQQYVDRLKTIVGEEEATRIVNNALIIISAATNDFIFNYYKLSGRSLEYNITGYQDYVLNQAADMLKGIYNLGGRKFAIAGLGAIGCMPFNRNIDDRSCNHTHNSDSIVYNAKLINLVNKSKSSLPGTKMVYVDLYGPFYDMVTNPKKYGFEEASKGCCGTGLIEVGPLCNSFTVPCQDPSKFVFWDAVHPSEGVYKEIVKLILDKVLSEL